MVKISTTVLQAIGTVLLIGLCASCVSPATRQAISENIPRLWSTPPGVRRSMSGFSPEHRDLMENIGVIDATGNIDLSSVEYEIRLIPISRLITTEYEEFVWWSFGNVAGMANSGDKQSIKVAFFFKNDKNVAVAYLPKPYTYNSQPLYWLVSYGGDASYPIFRRIGMYEYKARVPGEYLCERAVAQGHRLAAPPLFFDKNKMDWVFRVFPESKYFLTREISPLMVSSGYVLEWSILADKIRFTKVRK